MNLEKVKYLIEASDVSRAIAFYNEAFGFTQLHSSPFWAEIANSGCHIGIHRGEDTKDKETSISFQVADLDIACTAIEQAGGSVLETPENRPNEPIMLGKFKDTEGNILMLTKYLS